MSTGYRPPSSEPRGRWAQHLHAERKARNWSQTRAFEELREGLRLSPRSRSAYIAVDMGKRQPTQAEAEYLASVFGWPPDGPPEPLEQAQAPADLIAALMAQTAAINALVARLDSLASEAIREGVLDALGEAGVTRDVAGSPGELPVGQSA